MTIIKCNHCKSTDCYMEVLGKTPEQKQIEISCGNCGAVEKITVDWKKFEIQEKGGENE